MKIMPNQNYHTRLIFHIICLYIFGFQYSAAVENIQIKIKGSVSQIQAALPSLGKGQLTHGLKIIRATPYLSSQNSYFGRNIEGLSVTPSGKIYAVNYGTSETTDQLGKVFPEEQLFYKDPLPTAKFNGMQFSNETTAFVVDQNNTRLLRLDLNPKTGKVIKSSVHCSDPSMLPPNDLAISFRSGLIFLSAMNWVLTSTNKDGEIWVCTPDGKAKRLEVMGRVNGIELTMDEKTLYATEGFTRNWTHVAQKIWKYDVDFKRATIRNKQLFVDFANVDSVKIDLDGIKTDVEGNLLAVRYGGSDVTVFSPEGKLTTRIRLNILNPTNLELDKVARCTLFVCGKCNEVDKGCVDIVHWPSAGRSWLPYTNALIN